MPPITRILGMRWEVPPLQRYYLIAYWHSFEHANQPDARTQIRWLMETAPGRKRQWLFATDLTEGGLNDLSFILSSFVIEQGWTGIERTDVESVDSTEVEKLLREDSCDGESFRRLVNKPLLYGVAALVIVVHLAFMLRDDIGEEWRPFCALASTSGDGAALGIELGRGLARESRGHCLSSSFANGRLD